LDLSQKTSFNVLSVNFILNLPPFRKRRKAYHKALKEFACFNQGRYIQFEYLLGLKHKELKKEVYAEIPDKQKIVTRCDELLGFIHRELEAVTNKNFTMIAEYFAMIKKSPTPPRVCIKVIQDNNSVDLYRADRKLKKGESPTKYPINDNTGFKHVADTGTQFIENNIPEAAKGGRYINPRLNQQHVITYKLPGMLAKNKEADPEWCKCWIEAHDETRPAMWHRACYRSTMIIPMTLFNNDLSDEFKKSFFEATPEDNRTIWGFLCFDHPAINYFDDDFDPYMGYIFADYISLYLISAHIHTGISETLKKIDCKIYD